jgi:hypothetical protein
MSDFILTNSISDPLIGQPWTGPSLNFLQNGFNVQTSGLAQSIIGRSYNNANTYVLSGLQPYGTNQYYPGYIFYQGEIFYCAGKSSTTSFTHIPILTLTITNDPIADPLLFTDAISRNVHNIRTMVLSDGISGSGTVDLSTCIYTQQDWVYYQIQSSDLHFNTSVASVNGAAAHDLRYLKINNTVTVDFNFSMFANPGPSEVFVYLNLPAGCGTTVRSFSSIGYFLNSAWPDFDDGHAIGQAAMFIKTQSGGAGTQLYLTPAMYRNFYFETYPTPVEFHGQVTFQIF